MDLRRCLRGTSCGLLLLAAGCESTNPDTSAIDAQFDAMDSDGDDRLSPREHADGARAMFVTMDANADERVTAAEMTAATEEVTGHAPAASDLSAEEKIAAIDGDGDGVLTAAEHAAGAAKMFAAMDEDGDGLLTREELAAGHAAML